MVSVCVTIGDHLQEVCNDDSRGFIRRKRESREGNLAIAELEIDPFHTRVKALTAWGLRKFNSTKRQTGFFFIFIFCFLLLLLLASVLFCIGLNGTTVQALQS